MHGTLKHAVHHRQLPAFHGGSSSRVSGPIFLGTPVVLRGMGAYTPQRRLRTDLNLRAAAYGDAIEPPEANQKEGDGLL